MCGLRTAENKQSPPAQEIPPRPDSCGLQEGYTKAFKVPHFYTYVTVRVPQGMLNRAEGSVKFLQAYFISLHLFLFPNMLSYLVVYVGMSPMACCNKRIR